MRSPDEITDRAHRRYNTMWRDALLQDRPHAFPLRHPSAATITEHPDQVADWLASWQTWAIDHPSTVLRTRPVRTTYGRQPVYTHLAVDDTNALASINEDTAEHWARACSRARALDRAAVDLSAVRAELGALVDLSDADFDTLLSAVDWFRAHPRSGLTVRSVPVPGMHTKWLAGHQALVMACLGLQAPTNGAEPSARGLDALGLRLTSSEVSIVLAAAELRRLVGGLRQITAPIHELADLRLEPDVVLIIENKQPAIAWPDTAGLVIIHSLGNHLEVLNQLPWLPPHQVWYWGDLDRHGFTLLSRARDVIPDLRSLMMEPLDVAHHRHLAVAERLARYDPPRPTLTEDETQAMHLLDRGDGYLRIEQERLPLLDVVSRLAGTPHRIEEASRPATDTLDRGQEEPDSFS